MDAQQIKDLIASKIAGQGNQVDSGGALSTILDAIVDAVADAPKPIVIKDAIPITGAPVSALDRAGFTYEEVLAASQGKRTGVVGQNFFYVITRATVYSESEYEIAFYSLVYDGASVDGNFGYDISREGDNITVIETEI